MYKKTGRTLNLTEGEPLSLILRFAIPIFLGNLFQLLYSLIDTKIVGSTLGENALAAVGSVSTLTNLLVGFFNGLTLGFSVITARHFGSGDEEKLKRNVAGTILLGYGTTIVIIGAVFLCLKPILLLLHVPQEQFAMSYAYIAVLVPGMLVTFAYGACSNVLRAVGDSVTPLIFLILSAVLNVGLDYLFILNFGMGVAGAAVATVLSQMVSVVLCLLHIRKNVPILQVSRCHFKLERKQVAEMFESGLSMGLMSSLVNFGTLVLQTGINSLGTSIIVAHAAARKVFEIWNLPVSVLGSTMATYSSQNMGAGNYTRIRDGLKKTLLLGLGWAVVVILMAFTISRQLIGFIASSDSEEILYWGSTYLKFDMSFLMVCVLIVVLRNTMQGIGDYVTPVVSSFIELAGKLLFTFFVVRRFAYWGVIWTEPLIWIAMVIPLIVMIIRNPVMKKSE
ncbi:MAG: MATE family efflux transporter [Roseburia sp.]